MRQNNWKYDESRKRINAILMFSQFAYVGEQDHTGLLQVAAKLGLVGSQMPACSQTQTPRSKENIFHNSWFDFALHSAVRRSQGAKVTK